MLKLDFTSYQNTPLTQILTKFPDNQANLEQIIDLQSEVVSTKYILNDHQNMINTYRKNLTEQGSFVNPLWGKTDAELTEIATKMSVAEQAAQLMIWSFPGIDLTNVEGKQLTEQLPGGVILMGDNISSPSQLKHLSLDV